MPTLHINLRKIEQNTRLVTGLLKPHGVRLVGVTKACQGNELVAEAMLAGGAAALADARPTSVDNLRRFFPGAALELMRPVAGMKKLSAAADIYFVSTQTQATAIMRLCPPRPVRFCLMVDTGDGREGVPLPLVRKEAGRIASLDGAELVGLVTNAACARPAAPLAEAVAAFARAAAVAGGQLAGTGGPSSSGRPLLSAGGSGLLALLLDDAGGRGASGSEAGATPLGPVNELRCGEAILLGRVPSGNGGRFLPGAHRDAFVIEAPVLEAFEKEGGMRVLIGLGVQDVGLSRMIPAQAGIYVGKITSDYLIVHCQGTEKESLGTGAAVCFIPTYYSLLAAMASPFIEKRFS